MKLPMKVVSTILTIARDPKAREAVMIALSAYNLAKSFKKPKV